MSKSEQSEAVKAVAKRGIVPRSAYNNRSADGTAFPGEARRSVQRSVRSAMRRARG